MCKVLQSLGLSPACHRHVVRVLRLWPGLDRLELLDALVAEMEMSQGALAERSVRVYWHEYRLIVEAIVAEGLASERDGEEALARISAALGARLSTEIAPRTSALKATSISARDLKKIFDVVKARAFAEDNIDIALVGLLVVTFAVLGIRPVELTTLDRAGHYLRVENAKRGRSAPRYRVFNISQLPESWTAGIVLAAELYGQYVDAVAFYRTHRRLSQVLARISEEVLGSRVCFYALRHVAMATWKRAGIDGELIALLAGHISLRTARHYAPASSGHSGPIRIRPVAPEHVPADLFAERPHSVLIKQVRSSRRIAGVLRIENGKDIEDDLDGPGVENAENTEGVAIVPAPADQEAPVEPLPAPDETDFPTSEIAVLADTLEAAIEKELAYRRMMLTKGVRITGHLVDPPRPPKRDESDVVDLPILPTPPKPRRKNPALYQSEPDPDFEALITGLLDSHDDDTDPERSLSRPEDDNVFDEPVDAPDLTRTDDRDSKAIEDQGTGRTPPLGRPAPGRR